MNKIILIVLQMFSVNGYANLVIPRQINEIINVNGCSQISTFYEEYETARSGPYMYDLNHRLINDFFKVFDEYDESFAVICKKKNIKENTIFIYGLHISNPFYQCDKNIDYEGNVGSLGIRNISPPIPKNMFFDLTLNKYIKEEGTISGYSISVEYDGEETLFYCQKETSRWLRINTD
jgi:hypothetical protein